MINKIVNGISDYLGLGSNAAVKRIFIFSNLSRMRLDTKAQESLLQSLLSRFEDKTIYLPAFTYNSRSQVPYNEEEVPSPQNGSLSRVAFREGMHLGNRTFDEDYSYLVLGARNREVQEKEKESKWYSKSFGNGSHHEALYESPAIFFSIGNGLKDGFTPAMHVEALQEVGYRNYIDLPSQIMTGKNKSYYARNEQKFTEFGKTGRERLVSEFKRNLDSGFKSYPIGINGEMYAFSLREFLEVTRNALIHNPNFFVE